MARTLPYNNIENTLQTPKYLRTGNFVEFLTENQNLQQILNQDQDRSPKQLYVRTRRLKNGHFSASKFVGTS
jgi:hypothetical protein